MRAAFWYTCPWWDIRDGVRVMGIIEKHTSRDGLLKLVVFREDDGDMTVSFEGYAWHTHADVLAATSGLSEADALRRLIDDVLGDVAIIAVSWVGGEARDVWVTDDPASDLRDQPKDETIEFRDWSGRRVGQ